MVTPLFHYRPKVGTIPFHLQSYAYIGGSALGAIFLTYEAFKMDLICLWPAFFLAIFSVGFAIAYKLEMKDYRKNQRRRLNRMSKPKTAHKKEKKTPILQTSAPALSKASIEKPATPESENIKSYNDELIK
jgi:hypothetical protein